MNPRRISHHLFLSAASAVTIAGAGAAVPAIGYADVASCAKYASPSGSDSNSGSLSAPFKTPQELVASLSAGQTGCLRSGAFSGNVTIRTKGVTVRSAPGERATLTLDTLEIADGANQVTISDLTIVGGSGALTMRPIGDDFRIERNTITNKNAGMTCILVGGSSIKTSGGLIKGNVIHHCGKIGGTLDHGIYAQNFGPGGSGQPGLTIEDNVFYELAGYAIQLYPNGEGGIVRHNVIDGGGKSTRGGIVIDGTTARNHRIEQNVITYTKTGGIVQRNGSGHVARNNCFWQNPVNIDGAGIISSGNVTADPRFVNRSASDYRLAAGSSCLAAVGYDTYARVMAGRQGPGGDVPPAPTPAPKESTGTAPKVTIASPKPGARVRTEVRATAKASDDGRITKVEFSIDGRVVATDTAAPYDLRLRVTSLTRGEHTLTARAHDDAGLAASASVSFSKR